MAAYAGGGAAAGGVGHVYGAEEGEIGGVGGVGVSLQEGFGEVALGYGGCAAAAVGGVDDFFFDEVAFETVEAVGFDGDDASGFSVETPEAEAAVLETFDEAFAWGGGDAGGEERLRSAEMRVRHVHEGEGLIEIDIDEVDVGVACGERLRADVLEGGGGDDLVAACGPVGEFVAGVEIGGRNAASEDANGEGFEGGEGLEERWSDMGEIDGGEGWCEGGIGEIGGCVGPSEEVDEGARR